MPYQNNRSLPPFIKTRKKVLHPNKKNQYPLRLRKLKHSLIYLKK